MQFYVIALDNGASSTDHMAILKKSTHKTFTIQEQSDKMYQLFFFVETTLLEHLTVLQNRGKAIVLKTTLIAE